MTSDTFDIQELMTRSGVPRRTIHFYVQQGILPPPQGAGLAAYYTEDHLLRLQLIPVLRGQGLRLDQIRARFTGWDTEAMRKALEESKDAAAKNAAPKLSRGKLPPNSAAESSLPYQPVTPLPPSPAPSAGWGEERIVQYRLPGGITISAPEGLGPMERQRLNLLLQAAQRIFTAGRHILHKPGTPANGNEKPSTDFSEE